MSPILQVVIASTRPGRLGLPVAQWFTDLARAHGVFDVEVVDLAAVDLPLADEPTILGCGNTCTSTRRTGAPSSTGPTRTSSSCPSTTSGSTPR